MANIIKDIKSEVDIAKFVFTYRGDLTGVEKLALIKKETENFRKKEVKEDKKEDKK